jgi:hypothetical protein
MKRPMVLMVRGRRNEWVFHFDGHAECLADWRADGLEVYAIEAKIPDWAAWAPMSSIFSAAQRIWRWMRIW